MDLGSLRALTLSLNLEVHGVAITVTPLGAVPIATRGIWMTPGPDAFPGGLDLERREPQRILALSRTAVPVIPKGSIIVGPERPGGPDAMWRVDSTERVEADHTRVFVVPLANGI